VIDRDPGVAGARRRSITPSDQPRPRRWPTPVGQFPLPVGTDTHDATVNRRPSNRVNT
jgi:hypothetical protein